MQSTLFGMSGDQLPVLGPAVLSEPLAPFDHNQEGKTCGHAYEGGRDEAVLVA